MKGEIFLQSLENREVNENILTKSHKSRGEREIFLQNLKNREVKENFFKNLINREEKENFFLEILKIERKKRNEKSFLQLEREKFDSFLLEIFSRSRLLSMTGMSRFFFACYA